MAELGQDSKQTLSKGIQDRINQANGRLKSAKVGVTIQQIGNRLYLQTTLPPKPGSKTSKNHQQRITLGIHANPAGISLAEKEARKVGALVDCREFSWEPYLKGMALQPQTVGDWIARFEAEYRETVAAVTWKTDYRKAFAKLPQNEPISIDLLKKVLLTTTVNSKTRRRCFLVFTRLAKYAGLEESLETVLQGNYSATSVEPRDLPNDSQIVECWQSIKHPGWQWVFGMLAAFGLRSHECFFLDLSQMEERNWVFVKEGKTGERMVWAFYPEWVDQFNLRKPVLPAVTGTEHIDFTQRTCKFFGREAFGFTALDLRHRWAIRTLEFGLPYELAAKQMGHSVAVHERTYHRWLTPETHQRAYDLLVNRGDRPLPPGVSATSHSV